MKRFLLPALAILLAFSLQAKDNKTKTGSVSIQEFGVMPGNSPEVNRVNLQKAIDWAAASGTALYVTPVEGGYPVATGILLRRNVSLTGAHGPTGRGTRHPDRKEPTGSIFLITDTANPFITVESATRIQGIQFYYPDQTYDDPAAIIPYKPTIQMSHDVRVVEGVTLNSLTFYGEYMAMDFRSAPGQFCEQILFEHCYGYPLSGEFIAIDRCYDIPRILHCHVNPSNMREFDRSFNVKVIDAVVAKKTFTYWVDHTDNAQIMDIFTFGAYGGIYLGGDTYGQLTNFNLDCVAIGLYKKGNNSFNRNWQIAQGSIIANLGDNVEDIHPIVIEGGGHTALTNVECFSGKNGALSAYGKSYDYMKVIGDAKATVSVFGSRMRNYVSDHPFTIMNPQAHVRAVACVDKDEEFFDFDSREGTAQSRKELAEEILSDPVTAEVETLARQLIRTGFNAGSGYDEVWIRDYNTFIELAMEEMPEEKIRENLLPFFRFQGEDGNIPDGFVPKEKARLDYKYISSNLEPRFLAHKNTVETDQESSLILAVSKYVTKTGNKDFLKTEIGGISIDKRLQMAMQFLMEHRFNDRYGLLWGATTADWGDVQPEHEWGVFINDNSHFCIDIYDNALFISAIDAYLKITGDKAVIPHWKNVRDNLASNVRKHLWDKKNQKFIPHIYLSGSPFPADFDEGRIFYHGGTGVAMEAGLLSLDEIRSCNDAMLRNMEAAGATSIGITQYPAYPDGFFKNPIMKEYSYQNGGDWTWYGGRIITQLVRYGFIREAWDEARPMFARVAEGKAFNEWYDLSGKPMGSGTYRGEAGVLFSMIQAFRAWAEANK